MEQKIVDRLAQLRKEKGLSQEEVADSLFVSRQAVSKWERGESLPDTANLIALAKLYGLSIDELLFGTRGVAVFDKEEGVSPAGEGVPLQNVDENEEIPVGVPTSSEKADTGNRAAKKDDSNQYSVFVEEEDEAVAVKDEQESEEEYSKTTETVKVISEEDTKEEKGSFYQSHQWREMAAEKEEQIRQKAVPYPLLVVIIYLTLGFVWNLWHPGWIVFLTIPLHGFKKEGSSWRSYLASPVMTTIIYLLLGFYFNLWHPGWMLFLCIPIFQRFAH